MGGYSPLKVTGYSTGLVQQREEFILPNDAYPILQNAFVWRERIKRKQGCLLLGRLQRNIAENTGVYSTVNGVNTFSIFTRLGITGTEPNASIVPGNIKNITIILAAPIGQVLTDTTGTGTLTVTGAGPVVSATINYSTGVVLITANAAVGPALTSFTGSYNPNLPVMGLRSRELNNINNEQLVAFDQKYAYIFNNGWGEFLSNTASTWTGNDADFFWSTNYWVGDGNQKLFWVTNFSGTSGDPIRYTNGVAATNWIDFAPQIDASGNLLTQCLAMLPFRGRLVTFNTLEGGSLATSAPYQNRIRWSAIGNPITTVSPIVSTVNLNAWRDDIRGQGGFLDIPTSQAIIAVGFVRDNLVVYCERSTWQLRYTGRSISPFQIETVNSELGAESTFSAVQFDTSLVGVGDKGIVECDSFKSDRIDIKIPDLIFEFNNEDEGVRRVHGIRDFFQRLAFWTYPYAPDDAKFPNKRLVYNYENDSWAIFDDSYTTLGTYQKDTSPTWATTPYAWRDQNYPWISRPDLFPSIVGGNQQGYVEILDAQVMNDVSLYIKNIQGNTTTPTVITSIDHNLQTGAVIELSIPTGLPFNNLDGHIFGIVRVDKDTFQLWKYNSTTGQFSDPQLDSTAIIYIGGGQIIVKDNFRIASKKFNFLDEGQNIQLGFIDILMDNTENGAISLNVYLDYNDVNPINVPPDNSSPTTLLPDTFFNSVVPTSVPVYRGSTKNWQRVFCAVRGAFITIEWTLSNAQMVGPEQESDVQIDAQILWLRKAGKQLPIGV